MSSIDEDIVYLDTLAVLYAKSENPLCAWHAIRISIERDLPLPRWARGYFRDSANFLITVSPGQGKKSQAVIADAIGLSKTGVSFFQQFNDEHRKITIALEVQKRRKSESRPRMETTINETVGEKFGLKQGQVRDIYAEYSPWLDKLDK